MLVGCLAATNASASGPGPVSARLAQPIERLRVGEDAEIRIAVEIADGWHINSDEPSIEWLIPTSLAFELPAGVEVAEVRYPAPIVRQLKLGGSQDLELYEGVVEIAARLRYPTASDSPGEPVALLRYQACNDTLCLRPTSLRIPLGFRVSLFSRVARAGFNETAAEGIAELVAGGLWVVVPAMLLFGLALNLTPCVYPLISITVAYFGGQAGNSRARKLWLAISYTLGIALTFSVLGASAAMSGGLFGAALTNPLVVIGVAGVMVALALSSFGLYQIKPPDALAARLGGSMQGALGALFMGMTMGLVAAPCVGPVVVGLLVFVGSRGDVLLGFGLFFLLAIGLGIPYLVLALAAGSISALPRSGAWLQWTEHLFGCVLLAMAIFFLGPILPDRVEAVLMPAFLGLAIIYLAFIDRSGGELPGFVRGRRAAGLIALAALAIIYRPTAETHQALAFEPFSDKLFLQAKRSGEPFVVEFGAEWCLPCKEMEERTFTDPEVVAEGEGMTFIAVDMTTTDRYTEIVLGSFDVLGAPTTLFFGPDGEEWLRRIGFIGPTDFAELLSRSRAPEQHRTGASDGGA